MSGDSHVGIGQIVIFLLDEQSYALSVSGVVRVIHAIEIRHLPEAPEIIKGIINVKGRIIPVADIRKRFGLLDIDVDPDNHIIIAYAGKREVAILVDSVTGISELSPGQMEFAKEKLPFAGMLNGMAKVDENLVLIYDLEGFLSLDEEKMLDKSMLKEFNES